MTNLSTIITGERHQSLDWANKIGWLGSNQTRPCGNFLWIGLASRSVWFILSGKSWHREVGFFIGIGMEHMKRLSLLIVSVVVWSLLAAPLSAEPPRGLDTPLNTVSGQTLRLSDLKGQVVLVNFWATWCPPCLEEIPALINIQNHYRDKDFTVVGVDFMESTSRERLADFIKRRKINYPIVFGDNSQLIPLARDLGGVFGLPVTKILDRQGQVIITKTGGLTEKKLRELLDPLLADDDTTPIEAGLVK